MQRGGESVCKSLASLKALLNGLPKGFSVDSWPSGDGESQAMAGQLEEIKNACCEAGVALTVHPAG